MDEKYIKDVVENTKNALIEKLSEEMPSYGRMIASIVEPEMKVLEDCLIEE